MGGLAGESAAFDGALVEPAMGLPVERHAAVLGDTRLSHPANAGQKARMVTRLQRDYGNGYVQRVLDTMTVQASRSVDWHRGRERKRADDRPDPARQAKPATVLERGPIQRRAEGVEEKEGVGAPLRAGPEGTHTPPVSEVLERRIGAARAGGQPLQGSVRALVEPQLGTDLGDVRVHADAEADRLSRNLDAKAFTSGKDVFFRGGHHQPDSPEGRELLAHELTHVVQQSALPRVQRQGAAPRPRPRYRLVANLGTAQLTVFDGRNKVREMPVIFGRATSTLLRHRGLRIGRWREGFTTPSRTDYTACTWFKWGKELDRFPGVAFSGAGTAGTGTIRVRGRRYRVGTIVPGRKGEIYRHEPDWMRWETIEKYSNPFGKYATVIRGNFMLHGTDGEDGLGGGPFGGLTAEQRARVTHGCIRTSNADIEWLKDNVPARTRIKVRR